MLRHMSVGRVREHVFGCVSTTAVCAGRGQCTKMRVATYRLSPLMTSEGNFIRISEQQINYIVKTCIHFNGIQHKECEAGVDYRSKFGKVLGWNLPCIINECSAECRLAQYPTYDEAERQVIAWREYFERMRMKITELPDVELVAARAHEGWMEAKRAQGITSRKSGTGEELMVPYSELSEAAKDLDRKAVKAVYKAISELVG